MKISPRYSLAAFTLLEIMLVVAIITLLLGAGFAMLKGQFGAAQDTKLQADFQTFGQALDSYENFNGFLPSSEQGLSALVTRPTTEPKPTRWYASFEKLPKDPWQSDYLYVYPGKHNPKGYDIVSKGKDKILGTEDDRGNWEFK